MPAQFTLTALQKTCEAILGCALDKSTFRCRIHPDPDRFPGHVPELVKVKDAQERGRQRPDRSTGRVKDSSLWSRTKGASELILAAIAQVAELENASGLPNASLPAGRWPPGAERAA